MVLPGIQDPVPGESFSSRERLLGDQKPRGWLCKEGPEKPNLFQAIEDSKSSAKRPFGPLQG